VKDGARRPFTGREAWPATSPAAAKVRRRQTTLEKLSMIRGLQNVDELPKQISAKIPTDEQGHLCRAFPEESCGGYFKVLVSTSKRERGADLHCAYCGHAALMDRFWTKNEVE